MGNRYDKDNPMFLLDIRVHVIFWFYLRAIPLKKLVGRVSALLTHILGVGGLGNLAILRMGGPEYFVNLGIRHGHEAEAKLLP